VVPFKPLQEADEANGDDGFVKESDLKNHLEGPAAPKEKPDTEKEEAAPVNGAESRVNPLEMDNMKRDNQIMRALDILVSYDLFKHLGS
jgi:carboxyl-terminal processing protease